MDIYGNLFSKKGFSLDRLRSFCLVATAGGFNRAAGENLYRQSQYSRQIADLERFFGCSLFYREGRHIRLTDAGTRLLAIASSFFAEAGLFAGSAGDTKVELTISAGQSVIDFVIPHLLTERVSAHARLVTLRERSSGDAIGDVLAYRSLLAIATDTAAKNKDVAAFKIISSKSVMICKKDSSRFYVGSDLKRLAANPTALLGGSGRYRRALDKLFAKTARNIMIEAPSFSSLKSFAAAGTAMAYLPEFCISETDRGALAVHTFPRLAEIKRELYVICRKNLLASHAPLRSIVDEIRNVARGIGG